MRLPPVLTSVAAIIGMAGLAHADSDDDDGAFRTHNSGHYLVLNTPQNSGASQGRWSSRSTTVARPRFLRARSSRLRLVCAMRWQLALRPRGDPGPWGVNRAVACYSPAK